MALLDQPEGSLRELAAERRALADLIKGDPLLQRYFHFFLFEPGLAPFQNIAVANIACEVLTQSLS